MKKVFLTLSLAVVFGLVASSAFAQPFTASMAGDAYDDGSGIAGVPTANDTPINQNIHDAVNLLLSTGYTKNEQTDAMQVTTGDLTWKQISSGDNVGAWTFIGISAANQNILNTYKAGLPATIQQVLPPSGPGYTGFGFSGDGTLAHPFAATYAPYAPGVNFSFALTSTPTSGPSKIWSSDPFAFDNAGLDHMLTFDLLGLSGTTVYIKLGCSSNDVTSLYADACTTVTQYTFQHPYLITFEDKPLANGKLGDEDYNDMMFLVDGVRPNSPEPATMALLGGGLFGLIGFRRKKRA